MYIQFELLDRLSCFLGEVSGVFVLIFTFESGGYLNFVSKIFSKNGSQNTIASL